MGDTASSFDPFDCACIHVRVEVDYGNGTVDFVESSQDGKNLPVYTK